MAKIMQGECNGKTGKRSFTRVDTAEPPLIFYKDNASERQKSLLLFVRVPLIFYKCTEINYNNQIICRFLSDFIT